MGESRQGLQVPAIAGCLGALDGRRPRVSWSLLGLTLVFAPCSWGPTKLAPPHSGSLRLLPCHWIICIQSSVP